MTLVKLWTHSRSSVIYSIRELGGVAESLLMMAEVWGLNRRDAQGFEDQLERVEKNTTRVEPHLVSRSAGLRDPGHHIQLSAVFNVDISIILFSSNIGRLAGSFLATILSTISESPMNTGSEKEVLCSSRLIFCCI